MASSRSCALPDGSTATIYREDDIETVVIRPAPKFGDITVEPLEVDAPFAVYVPHTYRHPQTVAGVPRNAVWVDVAQSDIAYYAALCDWWSKGETFLVLEHDVVCRPDVIAELDACPEPWCLYGYDPYCHEECREAWRNALGCTRFRAELLAAVPDAVTSIPRGYWDWHNVCDGIGHNLRAAGFTHHWHGPPVRHHSWEER